MNLSFTKLPYLSTWNKIPHLKTLMNQHPNQISKTYHLTRVTVTSHKSQLAFKTVNTKINKMSQPMKTLPITPRNQTPLKIIKIFSLNLTSLSRISLTMRKKCSLSSVMGSKEVPTIWPWFIKESRLNYQMQITYCPEKTKTILNPTSKEWEKNLQIKSSTTFVALWMSKLSFLTLLVTAWEVSLQGPVSSIWPNTKTNSDFIAH